MTIDVSTSREDAAAEPKPVMLAEPAALDYFDSQSVAIAKPVGALEAWTIMTGEPGVAMRLAFKLRDAVSARFGVKRIGGFSGARRDHVAAGDRLDFFLVEQAAPHMLVLTARDRHLDVMICLTTSAGSATITASVVTKNAFGTVYMMPVGPAHRLIVARHLRRLQAHLALR